MSTTTRPVYTVDLYFCGERRGTASTHRTLATAVEAAGKRFRSGSAGWDARVVVPADEAADYTATDSRGRAVNLTH